MVSHADVLLDLAIELQRSAAAVHVLKPENARDIRYQRHFTCTCYAQARAVYEAWRVLGASYIALPGPDGQLMRWKVVPDRKLDYGACEED